MKAMLLALLFVFSVPAQAHFVIGNDLVDLMREWERANNESPGTDYTKAVGYSNYIKGVYDALDLSEVICPSGDVRVGQVSAVVAKLLTANPERWSEPAFFLVSDALKGAFPCRAKS